ncbi:unnamed protein product [Urochloa humidicola]
MARSCASPAAVCSNLTYMRFDLSHPKFLIRLNVLSSQQRAALRRYRPRIRSGKKMHLTTGSHSSSG